MKPDTKSTTVEPMAIARLRPSPNNARTHSKTQIRQIAGSIAKFGFTNPVLVGDDGEIIAGHCRVEAAKLLGLPSVPALRLSHLGAAERRAYVLADNKLALNAGWDRAALAVELQALVELEFDVEVTGFAVADIGLVFGGTPEGGKSSGCEHAARPAAADARVPAPAATVTRGADLWLLDRHRLLCVDPADLTAVDRLLDGEGAVFVVLEPALCDRIVHRFRQLSGQDATLAASGQGFADVAAQHNEKEPMR